MNESTKSSPQQPQAAPQVPAVAVDPTVNRSLGAVLSENYDAVQEDLRQANELAASLETQLAGKSKEVLHMRFLFEQTKTHLGHMQDSIVAMRKERHKLANDAMRAMGLELMVKRLTAERDRMKNELDGLIEGLSVQNAERSLTFDKRDRRVAELTFEVMKLRKQVEEYERANPHPFPARALEPRPLKTSAVECMREDFQEVDLEIMPTERVAGGRGKA